MAALALIGCLLAGAIAGLAAVAAARAMVGGIGARLWPWLAGAAGGAGLFGWAWAMTPPGLVLLASLVLAWCLLALAVSDMASLRLPDLVTLPLVGAGLVLAWRLPAADGILEHLIGAVAGYGVLGLTAWVFHRWRGHEGIGLGDAKLLAAAGAWLGWRALPSVLLLGCLGGLAWWSLARMLDRRSERSHQIPFGAPLCAATWLIWLYGPLTFAALGQTPA